jgi:hypothetical protein
MLERSVLEPVFKQFTKQTKIAVSNEAKDLIVSLINCVENDPHETWQIQQDRLASYFQLWQKVLPELLQQAAEQHGLSEQLTVIDVIYWTGQNLLRLGFPTALCPFPGPEELPLTPMTRFPWGPRTHQ